MTWVETAAVAVRSVVRPRCGRLVRWWDCDLVVECVGPPNHAGDHTDGLWTWDRDGVRTDGTDHTIVEPSYDRLREPLTATEVRRIRTLHAEKVPTTTIARLVGAPYGVVYCVTVGKTYRSVR